MNNRFEFTRNLYSGEICIVIPDIEEMILGIAVALETDSTLVYAGNLDETDDVMTFALDTPYMTQLRSSPEYHNAVFRHILKHIGYHYTCDWNEIINRFKHYEKWSQIMRDNGVLGVVSVFISEEYDNAE